MSTPLAAATWPRSASRPSLTSIIAVAPRFAASGPASYGGAGRRCPVISGVTRGSCVSPASSRARPAAAGPSGPATATRSPGAAPDRSTGLRPARSPRPVTARMTEAARAVSPPITLAPARAHSAASPSASSRAQLTGRSARRRQRDQQGGRFGAHGREVGQAPGRSLVPDVRGARPVPAEVPALEQEIGGGYHPAVGHGEHGRVITDADQRPPARRQPRRQRRDQAELPERGQRL